MEEPSSPMAPHHHLLPGQIQNAHQHPGGQSSPAFLPDVCLQEFGLPQPRCNGFLPVSMQQGGIETRSSLKENEDGIKMTNTSCVTSTHNPGKPSLRVDCHLYPPPTDWDTQQITPSPQSPPKVLHDNSSSGWRVPNVSLKRKASANDEGKRIGYDGTTRTPSAQLLKPTASSLGHRVNKPAARSNQVLPMSQDALQSCKSTPYYSMDSSKVEIGDLHPQDESYQNTHAVAGFTVPEGGHMSTRTFNNPSPNALSTPLDPFGKLNQSNHSCTSEEDEDMVSMLRSSSDLMEDDDHIVGGDTEGNNDRPSAPIPGSMSNNIPKHYKLPLKRSASWSPGQLLHRQHQGAYGRSPRFGRCCPDSLRSYNIDPVASQLLRACAVNEEEVGDQGQDPLSLSSHAIGRIPEAIDASADADAALCRSPKPQNFPFSTSMPDLHSPLPQATSKGQDAMNSRICKRTPMISEESPFNYPLSPVPIVRNASESLTNVEAGCEMQPLARPVPRKGMPMLGSPITRRASMPRNFGHGSQFIGSL